MHVIHHGSFNQYFPEASEDNPISTIPGVLFSRNENGIDFYSLRNLIPAESLVVLIRPGETKVFASSKGQLIAFPTEGMDLYEIVDPPAELTPAAAVGKEFDNLTGAIS